MPNSELWFFGRQAIIYKLTLDDLGIKVRRNGLSGWKATWANSQGITDIGIMYKEEGATEWTRVSCVDRTQRNVSGILTIGALSKNNFQESDNVLWKSYIGADGTLKTNRLMPIYVVIRSLTQSHTYEVQSYYTTATGDATWNYHSQKLLTPKWSGLTIGSPFNPPSDFTQTAQTVVSIFNAMTNIERTFRGTDINFYEQEKCSSHGTGGSVTISFNKNCINLGTVTYEIAWHVIDNPTKTLDEDKKAQMERFLKFAAHADDAALKWRDGMCYPLIHPNDDDIVTQYLVAAACQIYNNGWAT